MSLPNQWEKYLTFTTSLANRCEIIKELGRGGMGEGILAEDTNLKRKVAIKGATPAVCTGQGTPGPV